MSLFELSFTLTSVILALALTNIVASLHRLALARARVRWAPEPLLLCVLITMIIVDVWLDQWHGRDIAEITVGRSLLQVLKMMALYFAAASCLPEPDQLGTGEVDLFAYYDQTRSLSFGALIAGLLLFQLYNVTGAGFDARDALLGALVFPSLYATLILVRKRWYNILFLAGVILGYGSMIFGLALEQTPA
jgi:hypothetical protein